MENQLEGMRMNLKNYLKHHENGFRDRTMGIYFANSIRTDLISAQTLEAIESIVGSNNVILDNNIFSFSLGNMRNASSNYRIKYAAIIRKLKNIGLKK